jgi:pimeloyl-ACP methyl ester carboxylesterase
VAVLLLSVCGVLASPASPATATTATYASLPGMVLSSTTATLPPELTPLATAKRIQYVSTDITGALITATALIMTPKTNKQNKTVVWAHGTTGLADQCAPSANQDVFWPEARVAVSKLLGKGWTVAAPDYPGLGTAQPHPYLIGASQARSIIDSVKAARNLDGSLSVQYVIDGHSQGGQGALFASQIASSYDGNLVLKGTAAIAPVSSADTFASLIPGTPGQGYLVMGLYGLAAVDSTFNPNTVLATPAKLKTPVLTSGCLNEILASYESLNSNQLLVGGALPDTVVAKLAHYVNPAQTAPSAPIYLVQGTDDEAVPFFITHDILLPQLQAYPQPVTFVEIAGANHDTSVIESADQVATWIGTRI